MRLLESKYLEIESPFDNVTVKFEWPFVHNDEHDGLGDFVETIRLLSHDFNELRHVWSNLDLRNQSFECLDELCRSISSICRLVKDEPNNADRLLCLKSKRAEGALLKHVINQAYNAAVIDPDRLNKYEAFSPNVYGETSFDLVEKMLDKIGFGPDDSFVDLGSGVGQVVLQVAAAREVKLSYGIERAEVPAHYAVTLQEHFRNWMLFFGKTWSPYLIEQGDFLIARSVEERLRSASVVFVNNYAFGPSVDHQLKERFANWLKEGCKVISSKAFCPLNFRITDRNLGDIGAIMKVEELSPIKGSVSWTDNAVVYFVHTIDRSALERFFEVQADPVLRLELNEHALKRDRKGKPIQSEATNNDSEVSNQSTTPPKKKKKLVKHKGSKRPFTSRLLNNSVSGARLNESLEDAAARRKRKVHAKRQRKRQLDSIDLLHQYSVDSVTQSNANRNMHDIPASLMFGVPSASSSLSPRITDIDVSTQSFLMSTIRAQLVRMAADLRRAGYEQQACSDVAGLQVLFLTGIRAKVKGSWYYEEEDEEFE